MSDDIDENILVACGEDDERHERYEIWIGQTTTGYQITYEHVTGTDGKASRGARIIECVSSKELLTLADKIIAMAKREL